MDVTNGTNRPTDRQTDGLQELLEWPLATKYFSSLYQPPYCHCCHWWQSWWLELAELVLPLPLPSLLALALIWNTPDISHNISRPNIIFSPQFPQQFRQMMNIASLTGLTLLGWTDWDWTLCARPAHRRKEKAVRSFRLPSFQTVSHGSTIIW